MAKEKKELTAASVQPLFNAAIRRRDGESGCLDCGDLTEPQASHYFEVGGAPSLRFYPPNCHVQRAGCHIDYHQRSPKAYTEWMQRNVPEFEWMDRVRSRALRYPQPVLETIAAYCKADRLDDLTIYIEMLFLEAGVEGPEKMLAEREESDDALIDRLR